MNQWCRGRILGVCIAVLIAAGVAPAAMAQSMPAASRSDWSDIEGRIQYAYYTDDARALNGVLEFPEAKACRGRSRVRG